MFNGQPPREPEKPRGAWNWLNEQIDARSLGQEGIQGSGTALPHGDAIQKGFGRHDVSGIAAHAGSAAEKATTALGAKAYAQGEHVAFDSGSPSLHTAAHEAAHVVQHRRGSVPSTAIDGGPSTAHEQNANAVADRVTRGESAEGLLDQVGADNASAPAPVVQRTPKTEPPKNDASKNAGKNAGPRDLDTALTVGHQAVELLATAKSLLPAYRRAVSALDPMAAMELARILIGTLNQAEQGKREIGETLGQDPPQHWMVSRPGQPEPTESVVVDKWTQAGGIRLQLTSSLMMFEMELATQLGPQHLDGSPVMGKVELPKLAEDALPYLISEAGVVVELLGVVNEAMRMSGAKIGTCPQISQATVQQIVKLVTPWKSRPVNFGFLVAALRKVGLWDEINSTKSAEGKTLEQTNQAVAAQAKETGALADVGELDLQTTDELLGKRDQLVGDVHYTNRVTDGKAQIVLEKLIGAAADARGPLIKQMQKMGRLGEVCQHLPFNTVQAIHDAVEPFDKEAANLLVPFYAGKGGGKSMRKIYEDKITGDIEQKKYVRAYLWTFLETAHNALTGGFEREYSEAYDAREAGLITDDAFHSAAGKALGKAAAITIASAATGGAAGEFGEGLAAGLGASKSAASIIGAGVGGFGAGVGGHFAGDTFDQAFNGKKGFDSIGSYMKSGAEGGIMGTVLGGVSVGAGKYLGEGGAPTRPIDQTAARYPRSTAVLEKIRSAGFGAGTKVRAGATAAVIRIRVTSAELADMVASGLAVPRPQLAAAMGRLPPSSEVEISIRPMQMSATDKPTGSGVAPPTTVGGQSDSKLELEDVKVVGEKSENVDPVASGEKSEIAESETIPDVEATSKTPSGPSASSTSAETRSSKPNPNEVEHFEKGDFTAKGLLKGGGHSHDNMGVLRSKGYEELTPQEVTALEAEQKPFEDAHAEWMKRQDAAEKWHNAKHNFESKLDEPNAGKKLNDPKLAAAERARLSQIRATNLKKIEEWSAENKKPPSAGPEPKPEDFKINPRDLLSRRKFFYHQRLGESGAEIGGVSSKSSIHSDGHTWFPPGWTAEPIMKLLETSGPGIAETPMIKDGILSATKRTAWIKRQPSGEFEVAPPGVKDPAGAGYLKSSMITPTDTSAMRTVFPEMNQ